MKSFQYFVFVFSALSLSGIAISSEWDEASALAVLSSDTQKKAQACQALAVVGGKESVPALAALLDDPALASYARTALEVIDHPSAGEALRDALPHLSGRLLNGAVTSLGVRRDEAAVPALQELATNDDAGVAQSAITALGRIGSDEALATVVAALKKGPEALRISAAHAALAAADKLLRSGNRKRAIPLLESIQSAVIPDYISAAASTLSKK